MHSTFHKCCMGTPRKETLLNVSIIATARDTSVISRGLSATTASVYMCMLLALKSTYQDVGHGLSATTERKGGSTI